jgi:hypothetical protein
MTDLVKQAQRMAEQIHRDDETVLMVPRGALAPSDRFLAKYILKELETACAAGRIEGLQEAASIALFTPASLGCEAIYARIQELEGEK